MYVLILILVNTRAHTHTHKAHTQHTRTRTRTHARTHTHTAALSFPLVHSPSLNRESGISILSFSASSTNQFSLPHTKLTQHVDNTKMTHSHPKYPTSLRRPLLVISPYASHGLPYIQHTLAASSPWLSVIFGFDEGLKEYGNGPISVIFEYTRKWRGMTSVARVRMAQESVRRWR